MNNSHLVSIGAFAKLVKKSRQTIYNWMEEGKIKAEMIAGRWLIDSRQASPIKDIKVVPPGYASGTEPRITAKPRGRRGISDD